MTEHRNENDDILAHPRFLAFFSKNHSLTYLYVRAVGNGLIRVKLMLVELIRGLIIRSYEIVDL